MAYNEQMADRLRVLITATHETVVEKKMFSGLCFMVNDKMCVGVQKESIMVRIDPELADEALEREGVSPMVHSGRVMKGFVFVNEAALTTKKKLAYWVNLALDFNQFAKSSKKKKKTTKSMVSKKGPAKKR